MTYLKDFILKIEKNDKHELLKLWEEYCYLEDPDPDELIQILQKIKKSKISSFLGNYVNRSLFLLNQIKDIEKKELILKLIIDVQCTNSEELANLAFNFLKEKYESDKYFAEKLRLVGLRPVKNFQGAISRFELLNHLEKGNFVFHTGGWGVGEILDVSILREEVVLEFEYVLGKKYFTFKKALNTLISLPKDHFLSMRFGNPDFLEEEAKKDPVKIIKHLLKDLGPKTSDEIKEEICQLIIPEDEWTKWWQSARTKIKKSTKIETPKTLKDHFVLREKEVSHEEALYFSLEKKPSVAKTILLVYSFLKDFPESLKNEKFKTNLESKLKNLFSCQEITEAQKLQLLFILESVVDSEQYSIIYKDIIKNREYFADIIEEIEILAYKKKVLFLIKELKENWIDIFLEKLFTIKQNVLKEYIFLEVEKYKKEALQKEIEKLIKFPTSFPSAFVWYFQKVLKDKNIEDKDKNIFFEKFMILLDHLYEKEDHKDLMKKMVALLLKNKYLLVREFMKKASKEEVKEFLLLSTKCKALSDHDIKIIHSLGEVAYSSLKDLKKEKEIEDFIWTTKEGFEKIKKKLEHLTTYETIENAKEIKEARALGDLRENAEYKAALEKRARLQAEIKLISDQLNKARILTKEDVFKDKISPGSIIVCEDEKNNKSTFTILGPWDSDPEKKIFSFQSKLAKSMIGLKIGDKFSFQEKEFTVKKILNYFV